MGKRYAINKRCKTLASIRHFVLSRCRPTPYLYQYFANASSGHVVLCLPCVNWQRRAYGARKRDGGKPFLLSDHFATFMMEPGRVQFPDQRCILRLVGSLLRARDNTDDECNKAAVLMLGSMPVPVQAMVGLLPSDLDVSEGAYPGNIPLLNVLVRAWWEYNGQTPFFAHKATAKLVRRMIKDGESCQQPSQDHRAGPALVWSQGIVGTQGE